jgi:hypothetical protein
MTILDDANTLDLKLFPNHQVPVPVYDYQVPVPMTNLAKYCDGHWDLTIQRVTISYLMIIDFAFY